MTRASEQPLQELGWEPLCSSKTYPSEGGVRLTGDLRNRFTELTLLDAGAFDREGPIWIRDHEDAPGFHAVAVLYSDAWGAHERYFYAHDTSLSPLGPELLQRALAGDAAALVKVGRFMLEELGDFPSARIHLERAFLAFPIHPKMA